MRDFFIVVLMAMFSPSIAMIKRNEESETLCLTSLVMGNSSEGDPLTIT